MGLFSGGPGEYFKVFAKLLNCKERKFTKKT